MKYTAGQQSIRFLNIPQNSGVALLCDLPSAKILIVKATYYSTTSTTFASCAADVTATLSSYCGSSNNCYFQSSNQLFPGALFSGGAYPAGCGSTTNPTGMTVAIGYVCNTSGSRSLIDSPETFTNNQVFSSQLPFFYRPLPFY